MTDINPTGNNDIPAIWTGAAGTPQKPENPVQKPQEKLDGAYKLFAQSANSPEKELNEVKERFYRHYNLELRFNGYFLNNIALRKLPNGLFEVDIDAKNGKFLNPEYAIDANGEKILDYSNFFNNKAAYGQWLNNHNISEKKGSDGIYRFYDNSTGREISSFDIFNKMAGGTTAANKVSAKGDSAQISSDKMKATEVSPCATMPLSQDKNTIFCPTFQFAWDALCDFVGEKLILSDNPETAKELNTNKGLTKENRDISPESFLAMAGSKRDGIINKINEQLKTKFGDSVPLLKESMLTNPDDILAYAYLLKDLKFKNKFNNLEKPISFNNGKTETPVESFGIGKFKAENAKQREIMDQVKILYDSSDSSIVKLETTSKNDELILAKIPQGRTLEDTYSNMNNLINKRESADWRDGDSLQIPKIDFNISHDYTELEGKNVKNKGYEGYFIAKAKQDVKFSLNEEGARLESQAKIVMSRAISLNKNIVFDKPFLVCLRKKGSDKPYLLIWVNNPEILKQTDK
ncbi:MAG: hypothetical protein ABIH00_00635 [Armatimonadota bacterium]